MLCGNVVRRVFAARRGWPSAQLNVALLFSLSAVAARGEVSGVVLEQGTMTPIGGAMVTLQATDIRTTTTMDGGFSLPITSGQDFVIVAAKKFYFNRSATVDAPASGVQITLPRVPQDNDPDYQIEYVTCALCHPNQYDQFIESPMSKAGLNTWVHDVYDGTGTPGGMGGFVYTRDSMFAGTNVNSECASCHQPETWINNPFSAMVGPGDPGYPTPGAVHGVACDICHKVADVDVNRINFPGIFPGAVTFTRPAGPNFHQVQYGVLGDVDFSAPTFMRASYQPQLVAETCAACHQDANDPDQNHTYTGVISEPTYLEWLASPYGDPESPLYATCVDCHMPAYGATTMCEFLPIERDPDTIRHHRIEGTTPAFLENSVEMATSVQRDGGGINVEVDLTNAYVGHHVPDGVTIRNMILLVEAWRQEDQQALNSLGDQTVHDLGGVGNPEDGYFAGLPGKLFAFVNSDINGNGPTFFTEAFGVLFDTRIPALATDHTEYRFALPAGGGTVQFRARLIYRRSFRALVDAKQWTEDGHGQPLADLVPPDFGHLMEVGEGTIEFAAGDADGDGDADLFDFARFLDCVSGPGGAHSGECEVFDADGDGDVDLGDFGHLQTNLAG